MIKRRFSRLAAGLVLLVVLFTQAGMALLHTHQGRPVSHPVALHADSDASVSCQVCALDGLVTLAPGIEHLVLPVFSAPFFLDAIADGVALPFAGSTSGRAPPVC